ncbi:MAG: hypothetical protein GY710_02135 [Desulfobacteraceae bacterium]|nr:hypothetical protein [Desulfobacteraceae bacterium]
MDIKNMCEKCFKLTADEKKEVSENRFDFVALWVWHRTKKKDNREIVDGYQVMKKGNNFKIKFNKMDSGYNWMTSHDLYGWLIRLPLNHFAMEAEDIRAFACNN